MAEDLTNLPTAYIFTAEYDVLRDDAFLYASRLREYGVKVIHHLAEFGFHGILTFEPGWPEIQKLVDELAKHVSDNL